MAGLESSIPNLTKLIMQATEKAKKHSSVPPETRSVTQIDRVTAPDPTKAEPTDQPSAGKEKQDDGKTGEIDSINTQEYYEYEVNKGLAHKPEDLIGNQEFKALCDEIQIRAAAILANKTTEFFFSTAYLFAVNSGSGYKTSLKILENLLKSTGLFSEPSARTEYVLPQPTEPDAVQKVTNIIGTLEYAFSAPRIVSFDISAWLGHSGEQVFKNLLMHIFQNNTKCLIVFRIPYVREKLLAETNEDLNDIISTRKVVFEPFSPEELREIAERIMKPYGIVFSSDAAAEFDRRIDQEKRNGFFYGIHTVRKIVGDFIREMELQKQERCIDNKIITGELICRTTPPDISIIPEPGFEAFERLIGLEAVENCLREAVYQIQFARSRGMNDRPCMHMFFTGNPGTGKTTVARMLGNELKKQGILRIGKFFEYKGRDLCAEYVGQTTPKTVSICRQAYGSVLFIDEAYSLASSNDRNDYGREAIDALIAEMENHYDDLVVIFAGYPDEMDRLLALNPGMRSRVPYTIAFPNYSRTDLFKIFERISSESFSHAPGFDEHTEQFFMNLPQTLLSDRSFGNARFVRNLYERVWSKATSRCARSSNASIELTVGDFDAAAREFDLNICET